MDLGCVKRQRIPLAPNTGCELGQPIRKRRTGKLTKQDLTQTQLTEEDIARDTAHVVGQSSWNLPCSASAMA